MNRPEDIPEAYPDGWGDRHRSISLKPTDIPDGVWAIAMAVMEKVGDSYNTTFADIDESADAIARAILAERQRCGMVARLVRNKAETVVQTERDQQWLDLMSHVAVGIEAGVTP